MAEARRRIWWGDWPASGFATIDPERTIAVLPLAAIEQHGPHLPVSTDLAIMEGMLETAIPMLPEGIDVRLLPIQAIGKSDEHAFQPGTLTLPAPLLIESWSEIGACLARAGVRKILAITSHGGNMEVMGIATRELRMRHAMLAVKTSWERFGVPDGLFSEDETRLGIHGGDLETSLMLHFRPELVEMAAARDFASSFTRAEREFSLLRPTGAHAFAWAAADLNPEGVVGNAAAATAEKGRLTAAHQAGGFARLIADIAKARLADWIAGPSGSSS